MDKRRLIFIPINDGDNTYSSNKSNGTHWSLLVYYHKNNGDKSSEFHYFDSMANANYSYAWVVKQRMEQLLSISNTLHMITHSCPQQENSFDCGVFVVLFIDILVRRYADLRIPSHKPLIPEQSDSSRGLNNKPSHRNCNSFGHHHYNNNRFFNHPHHCSHPQRHAAPYLPRYVQRPSGDTVQNDNRHQHTTEVNRSPVNIDRFFWWIDYADLCNPNVARKSLSTLIDQYTANYTPKQ
ncbi:cysteine proteinase [Coemansia reversa NRRL 1564]|uniref:Cysteine proteinase n=1 Tax=Coemansia reversa (strain ATCC 12441 / NRRL 1564) TaxID=763665 RepID=A0A2G5B6D9_COERN|nr:cysteine proteinase [Coemansia reversa NRRL 1564]|eukprot:PIA14575.1 cysteine proteinase [Coemansia reversa NRRL 1564]